MQLRQKEMESERGGEGERLSEKPICSYLVIYLKKILTFRNKKNRTYSEMFKNR